MKKRFISLLYVLMSSMVFADPPQVNNTEKMITPQDFVWYKNPQWDRSPRISFTHEDLEGVSSTLEILIFASEKGLVTKTEIQKSSGSPSLDAKVAKAIKASRFKPLIENGVASPIRVLQPFAFSVKQCELVSENWLAQEKSTSTSFHYQSNPSLTVAKWGSIDEFKSFDISFMLSKQNEISDLKINNSDENSYLNRKILAAMQQAQITAPRKFYQSHELKFTDRFYFKSEECQ